MEVGDITSTTNGTATAGMAAAHDDVIKWRHFRRYWPFVRGIHRSSVNSPYKSQRRGALMFSLIWAWINGWVNTREAGDLRRHRDHYGVTVMDNTPHIYDHESSLLHILAYFLRENLCVIYILKDL